MSELRSTLLVIDDEPLNRDLLRRVLQGSYAVEEAEDAERALECLEGGAPIDLILCDQLMPGRNGTELAALVRARWPKLPFLLLTGYDLDEEVMTAQDRGLVLQVISKPWRATELREIIAALMAKR